jgi:hypothetical protein
VGEQREVFLLRVKPNWFAGDAPLKFKVSPRLPSTRHSARAGIEVNELVFRFHRQNLE